MYHRLHITLSDVKKAVGDRMCIFGNIQLSLLENGKPEDVSRTVRKCMEDAKKGGGYVIMPTAAPINSPLSKRTEENYLTFIDSVIALGGYE